MYLASANPAAVVEYRLSCASQLGGKSTQRGASRKAGFVGEIISCKIELNLEGLLLDSLRIEVDGTDMSNESSALLEAERDRCRIRLNNRNSVG
jgi:hypothetical protein